MAATMFAPANIVDTRARGFEKYALDAYAVTRTLEPDKEIKTV